MESIPSQRATFHAIPCVSWRIKHTRKTDLGEDYQQRMIKMLPSVAWIVGSRKNNSKKWYSKGEQKCILVR